MLLLLFISLLLSVFTVKAEISPGQSKETSTILNSFKQRGLQKGIDSQCLDCICQQETPGCKHDQGCEPNADACGPFQIRQPYFQICCNQLGLGNCDSDSTWRQCALDYNCALRCVKVCCVRP